MTSPAPSIMDNSADYDFMDWQEDSSLHIIQPASSPWRKRSYDTYNDTNQPDYPNYPSSGYRVTDTLRNYTGVVAPFIEQNPQPAQYLTHPNGNTLLQPIIQPQSRKHIGRSLLEFVTWAIGGVAVAVLSSVNHVCKNKSHYATVAVSVGDSAKRRLVEVTRKTFTPASPRQEHRHDVPHHRRRSPLIRRVSPTVPGGRTHIPLTPPRARLRATLNEVAGADPESIFGHTRSNIENVESDAVVTSAKNDHLMSGLTHHPYSEPLMSGALLDIEMDEDVQSSLTASSSPYHVPGMYPYSPALPGLPSTEMATSEGQASDERAIAQEVDTDYLATSNEQAVEEVGTPHSEASDEPYTPEAQPTIPFPSQLVDTRPRNYKGELLDDWQIKVCKEFQAIHPPPRQLRQQTTSTPKQLQGLNPTGLIDSHRSPLANGSLLTPYQQHKTTTTGLIDSRWSPVTSVSGTGAAHGTMDLQASNTGIYHQPTGVISTGLDDSHRSPLDLHTATTEVPHNPKAQSAIGSSDLYRSPLADVSSTIAGIIHNDPDYTTSEISFSHPNPATNGSIDSPRSPLVDVSSTVAGVIPNDVHNTTSETTHSHPSPFAIGSIDSLRSPLTDISPINSSQGTDSIGSIDSPRSPLADASLIHLQLGMNPSMPVDQLETPLTASSMESAVDAMVDTRRAGPNISDHGNRATPVPLRSPATNLLSSVTIAPADSPSKWSIRSLYARVNGKPKKRSPLCERINNGNIHKTPKTPKRVTWPEHGPVTGTKRFIKNEAMSHPSPTSSREDSSILSSVPSDLSPLPCPTMQEDQEEAALNPPYHVNTPTFANDDRNISQILLNGSNVSNPVATNEHTDEVSNLGEDHVLNSNSSSDNEASVRSVETPTKSAVVEPSTPPSDLFPKLEELTISSRRSSLRRREKEDQARKLRDAIAAEEKARKDKEEAEEKARKAKEEAEERARIKAEEEEERKMIGGRRLPIERVIQSLPPGWDEKVQTNMAKGMREQLAMTSVGNPLTRRDFGMVLPQLGTGDDPSGWLNDEIISGYLQAVVDHGHRAMGHPRGAKPRMHAFNPFFYTTLKERGYDAVKRWSSRAKIGGNDLKNVEYVFIPCNPSRNHWTLVVVSPVRKTIEVFDSMHGASSDKVNTTKSWLRGELGRSYVDAEWNVIEDPEYPGRGKGPVQNNANDCGVFAVTTAKMVVLGVDPMAVSAEDMPLQRRRLVAELLNGGFSGEFEPHIVFE